MCETCQNVMMKRPFWYSKCILRLECFSWIECSTFSCLWFRVAFTSSIIPVLSCFCFKVPAVFPIHSAYLMCLICSCSLSLVLDLCVTVASRFTELISSPGTSWRTSLADITSSSLTRKLRTWLRISTPSLSFCWRNKTKSRRSHCWLSLKILIDTSRLEIQDFSLETRCVALIANWCHDSNTFEWQASTLSTSKSLTRSITCGSTWGTCTCWMPLSSLVRQTKILSITTNFKSGLLVRVLLMGVPFGRGVMRSWRHQPIPWLSLPVSNRLTPVKSRVNWMSLCCRFFFYV